MGLHHVTVLFPPTCSRKTAFCYFFSCSARVGCVDYAPRAREVVENCLLGAHEAAVLSNISVFIHSSSVFLPQHALGTWDIISPNLSCLQNLRCSSFLSFHNFYEVSCFAKLHNLTIKSSKHLYSCLVMEEIELK